MSDHAPAHKTRWGCLLGIVGFVLFLFLMMAGIGPGLLETGWIVLFGWTGFISRVVPKISWDFGPIMTGIIFTLLFAFLAHRFLAWFARGIAAARNVSFQWQWKWTLGGMLLVFICFLVGMSVAGAAHQIGWIMGSEESLYEDRYGMFRYREMSEVDMAFRQAMLDTNTLSDLRKDVPNLLKSSDEHRVSPLATVRTLVSLSPSNTVNGVIIVSTDRKFETKYGGRYVTATDSSPITPSDLKALIESNATNFVSF